MARLIKDVNIIKIKNLEVYDSFPIEKKKKVLDQLTSLAKRGFIILVPDKIKEDLREYQVWKMMN